MVEKKYRENPFTPGYGGRVPPMLAGREEEKRSLARDVEGIARGGYSGGDLALIGPRGMGKTTLLNWLSSHLEKEIDSGNISRKVRVEGPVSNFPENEDPLDLFRKKSMASRIDSLEMDAKVVKAIIDVSDDGRYSEILKQVAKETKMEPLVVLIDEAHELTTGQLKRILNLTQDCRNKGGSVVAVLAGTPHLRDKLEQSRASFVERGVEVEVGPIPRDSSREAIEEPLRDIGNIRVESSALEKVLEEAQCYPYFVQLWGQTLWEQANRVDSAELQMADVNRCREAVESNKARLYEQRFERWEDNELAALTDVARRLLDGSDLGRHGIVKVCKLALEGAGQDPAAAADLHKKLVNEGVIFKKAGQENYGPGIPSFLNYIVEQAMSRKRQDREVSGRSRQVFQ